VSKVVAMHRGPRAFKSHVCQTVKILRWIADGYGSVVEMISLAYQHDTLDRFAACAASWVFSSRDGDHADLVLPCIIYVDPH
jgi:hypothetical protein